MAFSSDISLENTAANMREISVVKSCAEILRRLVVHDFLLYIALSMLDMRFINNNYYYYKYYLVTELILRVNNGPLCM